MNELRRSGRLGVGLLSVSMLLVACSTAGAPPASSPPVSSPPVNASPDAPVTAPPSDGSGGDTDPGGIGGGKLVVPKPGQLEVRDVQADEIAARADGTTIVVTVSWTSGVEPCNVLDEVRVTPGEAAYAITLREGHGPEDVACIAIAETHRTEFAIQDVQPGTYRISDSTGGAAPVEVTVG
jgi:hypothetical protein